MEEGIYNVYNNWLIFNNYKLIQNQNSNFECKKWIEEFKKIQSLYIFNTKYEENKTLLFGYHTNQQIIVPMDVIMNNYVIVIPKTINNMFEQVLSEIVGFITNSIKSKITYEIANEIRFKMSLYLPIVHQDNNKIKNHNYFEQIGNNTKITFLGRTLQEDHLRYDLIFKFDNCWNLIPSKTISLNINQNYFSSNMES